MMTHITDAYMLPHSPGPSEITFLTFSILAALTMKITSLTHWVLNTMVAILQTTFSNVFSWMKIIVFWFKFHWRMVPSVLWYVKIGSSNIWLDNEQVPTCYLSQCLLKSMSPHFITKPLWWLPCIVTNCESYTGLILCLHPANERRRYKVTPSPIGCAQT